MATRQTQPKTPLDAVLSQERGSAVRLSHKAKIGETAISQYRRGLIPPDPVQKRIARALHGMGLTDSLDPAELWPR